MNYKIFQTDAEIVSHNEFAGNQFILRLKTEKVAKTAQPGSFVHIQCDPSLKLRRPISIMRADKTAGTIDLLYKKIGRGTGFLAQKTKGELLNILGPIGKPFEFNTQKIPLLIGGGVGMPPMIFLAETFKEHKPLVILGSEVPFPFKVEPANIMVSGIGAIGTMPLLSDLGIACRLASRQDLLGVHQGFVTDLAKCWLDSLVPETLKEVVIYSCGPEPMLKAVHDLAQKYGILCQVSLEEFMACGVGGCATCVVKVTDGNNTSMQRVCVDGPVFDSSLVF